MLSRVAGGKEMTRSWYWPMTRSQGIIDNGPTVWPAEYKNWHDECIASMIEDAEDGMGCPFKMIDDGAGLPSLKLLLWLFFFSDDDRYFWFGF
jgi:hypothetical protein